MLDAKVLRTVVVELDMVRDLTIVDVRFRTNASSPTNPAGNYANAENHAGTYELAKGQSTSQNSSAHNGAKQETWS